MSHRLALAGLLIAFVMLATAYSVVIPLGEAPDEVSHFQYVEQLREQHRLPTQDVAAGEAHQPPLYYALGVLLTAWIPHPQFGVLANPEWALNNPDTPNLLLHTRQEQFPFADGALAWHLLRLFSVGLGAVTVGATYFLALEFFPNDHALALSAAAFVAFIPAFTFLSAVVNNDNLVITLSALALLVFFRTMRGTRIVSLVVLGLLLGLAALAKISALALWLPIGGAMLLGWHVGWRGKRLVSITTVLVVAVIVIAPWLIYNQVTFGDPLNSAYMLTYSTPRPAPMSLTDWNIYATRMFESFWGKFGGAVSLVLPLTTYQVLTGLVVLGGIGVIPQFNDWRTQHMPRVTQIAWVTSITFWALLVLAQIRLMLTMMGMDQARQIFAGLPAFGIFIVAGILRLTRRRNLAAKVLALGMGLVAIAALYFAASIYAPRYLTPPTVNVRSIDFGGKIRVTDYRIEQTQVVAGDSIPVQIDWQALQDVSDDDWLLLQLVAQNTVVAQQEGVPSNGRTTTDWWRAGQTFSSRHTLIVPTEIAPGDYQLRLGLHPLGHWEWLPVRGGEFYALGTIEVQ